MSNTPILRVAEQLPKLRMKGSIHSCSASTLACKIAISRCPQFRPRMRGTIKPAQRLRGLARDFKQRVCGHDAIKKACRPGLGEFSMARVGARAVSSPRGSHCRTPVELGVGQGDDLRHQQQVVRQLGNGRHGRGVITPDCGRQRRQDRPEAIYTSASSPLSSGDTVEQLA